MSIADSAMHEEPLGFALGAAARRLAKFYAQALAGRAVTPSQLYLLRQLWQEDGLAVRDLGLRAQLDATSTTWLVDQLEQAHLVDRKRNDRDRRVVRIWLTAAGRQLEYDLAPLLARWEQGLTETLLARHSSEEIAAFRHVLSSLAGALPDGDDLWQQISAAWDTRLDTLRALLETSEEQKG